MDILTPSALGALGAVLLIDLALAGDNMVVIGLAAAGLPPALRRRAILLGVLVATALRLGFASIAMQLLAIIGLTLAGGILLLWVAWKMGRELRARGGAAGHGSAPLPTGARPKTLREALVQIVLADVSMSLDNVLAVAGAAGDHGWVLVVGLAISVALTGVASTLVANLLNKYAWIAYAGLAVIAYVAVDMIWRGLHEVIRAV
jgi:YjbE family integral membrane protein